jgi:hypothetical protein
VLSAAVVAAGITFMVKSMNAGDDPASGSGSTQVGTLPNVGGTGTGTGGPPATTAGPRQDLLTPDGARQVVAAMTAVMGGSQVSDFTLYTDSASATAPATAVKNGFDDFQYRDGIATREGPDTVDADRAVLDLNQVNWDALPALWQRAEKDLGVDSPTMRYIVVDTDIIDGTPSFRFYLTDDYGAAYVEANLAGEVTNLYPRG